MEGRAYVGCSGWVYRDWRGVVYPEDLPQRLWFSHYATLFDTVELNATFYRLPTVHAIEAWAEQSPPGFVYAAELGAFGSHRMKLREPTWVHDDVFAALARYGAALCATRPGCALTSNPFSVALRTGEVRGATENGAWGGQASTVRPFTSRSPMAQPDGAARWRSTRARGTRAGRRARARR